MFSLNTQARPLMFNRYIFSCPLLKEERKREGMPFIIELYEERKKEEEGKEETAVAW